MTSIVLIGPPAAGKTRTGRRVAKLMNVPFIDTDHRITAEHGPIPEFFATRGEAEFRRVEAEAVREALAENTVVSLGGGAITDAGTRALLADHFVILLTISAEAVLPRIQNAKRPLIRSIDDWKRIAEARRELYDELADLTIDTSHLPFDRSARRIVDEYRKRESGAAPGAPLDEEAERA